MKTRLLMIAAAACLAACASPGKAIKSPKPDSVCGETTRGYNQPNVLTYRSKNRFELSVKLDFEAGRNSEFQLKLDPKQDSDDAVITLKGVSGELPGGGGSTDFSWLDWTGTAESLPRDRIIVFCVPDVPEGTTYKFDIDVAGIGTLDPRVDVTW